MLQLIVIINEGPSARMRIPVNAEQLEFLSI